MPGFGSGASLASGSDQDLMLRFLFPRLTDADAAGARLFSFATSEARQAHWYLDGGVADTIDGRFRVLATILALSLVRLERSGDEGIKVSVTLTERFIEVMESEHRELGLGDPKLGRTVRKLVGALSRRVELLRDRTPASKDWTEAVRNCLYSDEAASAALQHSSTALQRLRDRLTTAPDRALLEGTIA